MNIFVSNFDPEICALEHCITHVKKQLLESYQMLSTVHRRYRSQQECDDLGLYKKAHHHHPCTLWAGDSDKNYLWLHRLAEALGEVYEAHYGKVHLSQTKLLEKLREPPSGIIDGPLTDFPLCMPEKYKVLGGWDTNKSYQLYLNSKYIEWTTRTDKRRIKPEWWADTPHWVCPTTQAAIDLMDL